MIEEEQKMLSRKMQMVSINDAKITTDEKPIIGTQALATCFGVLIVDEIEQKAAIVHVSSTWQFAMAKLLKILDFEGPHIYKFNIFPGYYSKQEDHYQIESNLNQFLSSIESSNIRFIPFLKNEISSNAVALDEATLSYEFAYDVNTKSFVTDKVLFGRAYLEANEEVKKKQLK